MSISSALSSECDEKQLLVHQTSGTTIVSMEDFADFGNHCPSTRMNKAVSCGATSLSDVGGAAMNNATSCRGSMTSFESTSSGGMGACSLNSHSSSSRHCSHSPSGKMKTFKTILSKFWKYQIFSIKNGSQYFQKSPQQSASRKQTSDD